MAGFQAILFYKGPFFICLPASCLAEDMRQLRFGIASSIPSRVSIQHSQVGRREQSIRQRDR
jgi:hypothetical protein